MRDLNSLSDAQLAAIAGEIDPDTDALVRTVWGEARNQGPEGRKAVAAVIRNRSRMSGRPISDIVRAPGQFEPWGDSKTRPQLEGLDPAGPDYQSILRDVEGDDDPTGGATHFYAPKAQAALGRAAPKWDDGSGFDIGDHRFFRLSYGDDQPATPKLEDLSDEELERIAGEKPAEAPKPSDPIEGAEFVSAPATAATARRSKVVDSEEGKAATPEQEAWYVGEVEAGRLDAEKVRSGGYRPGSEEFPLLQRDPQDLPKPGDWYVTPAGEKKQVPEVPMLDTIGNVARFALDPGFRLAAQSGAEVLDPRADAMRRAVESGVLLGGRNELIAGIESIPALFEGGVPRLTERFGDTLEREDRANAQARRDFPLAYDASAVTGGLMTGAALPSSLGPRLATGAGSGFLATDGDLSQRAIGAGVGVAGGEIAGRVLPKAAGALLDMSGVPRKVGPEAWSAADNALQRLGTKLEELTPAAREFLAAQLARGAEPADAAVLALNKGLPEEIPLIRGDVTGLPGDQMNFNTALRGGAGDAAAADAQGMVSRRQDAIRNVSERIAAEMAGNDIPRIGAGGARVSDRLSSDRLADKGYVDASFDSLRKVNSDSALASYDAKALAGDVADALGDYDPEAIPRVAKQAMQLDALAAGDAPLVELERARARLSKLRSSSDPVEAGAAGAAVRAFDRKINEAIKADLFTGDKTAAAKWKAAIKARREFGEKWQQGDLLDDLTAQDGSGGARKLKVAPEDAANYIFGRSGLGVGRRDLQRDLGKLRDQLGPDSEEWNALRAEAFLRLARQGEGGVEAGAQQFSGANFLKAWNKAKSEDGGLVDTLFKPEERATINQYAALTARITSPVKGGDNPSNSAITLLRKISGMAFNTGKLVPVLNMTLVELEKMAGRAAARGSMKPIPRKVPIPKKTIPGAGSLPASAIASERN